VALAWGLVLEPDQRLIAWRARPTEVSCEGVVEAKVDFTLEFNGPAATVVLTIGALPDGKLVVCTY
jgi:hypothetical protein